MIIKVALEPDIIRGEHEIRGVQHIEAQNAALLARSRSLIIAWTMGLSACADPVDAELMGNADKSNRPWVEDSFKQNHPMSDSSLMTLTRSRSRALASRAPPLWALMARGSSRGWGARLSYDHRRRERSKTQPDPALEPHAGRGLAHLCVAATRSTPHDRAMGCGCPDGRVLPSTSGLRIRSSRGG